MSDEMMEQVLQELKRLRDRVERLEAIEHTHTILNWVVKVTDYGGLAVQLTAGEDLTEGNVVCLTQAGTAMNAYKVPTAGNELDMPFGAALSTVSSGGAVWVVFAGMAYVLPVAIVTATKGYLAYCSTSAAGRVDQAATIGAAQHWREVGHWLENGSGVGVKARLMMHFN